MFPPREGLAGDTPKAVKKFRPTSKGGCCGTPGERLTKKEVMLVGPSRRLSNFSLGRPQF